MGHGILTNHFVDANGMSAWHRINSGMSAKTAVEAVEKNKMDWDIEKYPTIIILPDGTHVQTGMHALVRPPVMGDDTYATLGTCGADYSFWQNAEVARMVDMLTDKTGWAFSTAGVIDNGATIFICLEAGEYDVSGDLVKRFFVYKEKRDGKTKSAAIMSNTRVVCRNTLDIATRNASGLIKIRHHGDYKSDSQWAMDIIAEAHKAGETVSKAMNMLTEIMVTDQEFGDMLADVVPMPTMPNLLTMPNLTGAMKDKRDRAEYVYTTKVNMANTVRNRITANWIDSSDIPATLNGTAWGAYQAVTRYTSHDHGTLGAKGRKMGVDARAAWDLADGTTMRNAAYEYLTSK